MYRVPIPLVIRVRAPHPSNHDDAQNQKKPPVPFVYRTDYSIKTSENTSTPAREADKNTR